MALVEGESGGPLLYRNSWGPKTKPNQTNIQCNTKNPNIAIHIGYPIAALFGDGTSLVKGESGGPELYRNSWGPKANSQHINIQPQPQTKHKSKHELSGGLVVCKWWFLLLVFLLLPKVLERSHELLD